MKQEKRIMEMEAMYDRVVKFYEEARILCDQMDATRQELNQLQSYYETDWMQDFRADEEGLLDPTMKRGILTEDALYNLFYEMYELKADFLSHFRKVE